MKKKKFKVIVLSTRWEYYEVKAKNEKDAIEVFKQGNVLPYSSDVEIENIAAEKI